MTATPHDPTTGRFVATPRPVAAADISIGEVVHIGGRRHTLASWARGGPTPFQRNAPTSTCVLRFTDGFVYVARFNTMLDVERPR